MKTLHVMPGKNEDKFMEILHNCKQDEKPVCRLGAIWGTPYNEYDISMKDYEDHKDEFDAVCNMATEAFKFDLDTGMCVLGCGLLLVGLIRKFKK